MRLEDIGRVRAYRFTQFAHRAWIEAKPLRHNVRAKSGFVESPKKCVPQAVRRRAGIAHERDDERVESRQIRLAGPACRLEKFDQVLCRTRNSARFHHRNDSQHITIHSTTML